MKSDLSASRPRISIALCTFNGAEFLAEQLESFRRQTRLPDELIIGDDCSNDETHEIIKDFAEAAPFPVHLKINKKNMGSTENFQQTISRAGGELIFLSDQDDVWQTEKISVMEREFEKNPKLGLVFSDAALIDENSKPLGSNLWDFTFTKSERSNIKSGKSFETLLRRSVITGATLAFRGDLRGRILPIPHNIPNLLHDAWIALFCSIISDIKFVEQPLIGYRQHSSQQIGVDWQRGKTENLVTNLSRNAAARTTFYDHSIKFAEDEIERIEKTVKILKDKSETEDFTRIQTDLIDKLAGKFIAEKQEMILHYKTRNDLPKNKFQRIVPIFRELLTKRYHNFSRGFLSAGKDLLEIRK
jgi:glycosyltransferase involved in cell wall biosynthesis